jgi:hypothetical protein
VTVPEGDDLDEASGAPDDPVVYPPMIFSLRISLPDLPGTLGRIASAFGKGGVNILTLDVVDREDGVAIDDVRVEAPHGMKEALRQAALDVPGFTVEYVRPHEAFRHVLEPLELAALLAEEGASAVASLVEHLSDAFGSSWAMVVDTSDGVARTVSASLGAPSVQRLPAAWLDFSDLAQAGMDGDSLPRPRATDAGLEVAAALLGASTAVLLGREHGPRFRAAELVHLRLVSRIAASAAGLRAGVSSGAPRTPGTLLKVT